MCSFKDCSAALGLRNRSGLCDKHRRILYTRKWNNEHPEYSASRYKKEKEQVRARIGAISKSETVAKNKAWYQNNKEKAKELAKNWTTENKSIRSYISAKYRAKKLNATPRWLTKDQLNDIKLIYKNKPEGYHVDHVVPLQGENVCGLHVAWNLQYLTISENCSKSNKHD